MSSIRLRRHHLWYTYLVFFFVVVAVVNLLDFLMGRIVDITAQTSFDFGAYDEVPVFGDLSAEDEASYIPFDLYDNKVVVFFFVVFLRLLTGPG